MVKDVLVHEGTSYNIVLLDEEARLANDCNYGVVHKEYKVVEVYCGNLPQAFSAMQQMEELLSEWRPKPKLTTVH